MTLPEVLKERTKKFSVQIVQLADKIKPSPSNQVIIRQIVRSATSIGANYRAACRARSKAEFISKLQICLEESDETLYWLELASELHLQEGTELEAAAKENDELVAIFVSALKTARKHL